MYPKNKASRKDRGLVSYAQAGGKTRPTRLTKRRNWGEAYTRSMRQEQYHRRFLVLLDTAIKPKYQSGEQQYGSVEGDQSDADPLLPLFREALARSQPL